MMALLTAPASAAECDIAILNGRVMDPETSFGAVHKLCVSNGWITEIQGVALKRILLPVT